MKKLLFLSISLIFFSCASSSFFVPGSGIRTAQSLYSEYLSIADSYLELKQYDKAEKYYLKARNSKELYWGATEKLARIYGLQGKWEDAEREYKVLIKRDPDNINLKEALAYIYAMEGNFDFALNDYSNLLNSNPDSQELNENYLIILISAGKNEDALDFLLTFEEKFPDNSNLQTYHSKLEQIKDTEETGEQDSDDINEKDISESVFTETSLEDLNLN